MNEEKSKQTLKAFIIGLSLLVIGIALIVVGMVFDKVQRDAFIPTFKGDKYAPIWYIYLLEMGGALLFLLSFGGIYTFLAEKLKWKRMNVKQMSVIAIFAALSVILYYFAKFNLPFFPSWLDIQFSDVPAILVTFMYGPFSGVITVFVRFFCKLPGTSTVGVGEMADLLIGLAMVIPAGLIYKKHRTLKGAFVAMAIGMASGTLCGVMANWLILIPAYVNIAGFPWAALYNTMDGIISGGKGVVTESNFMAYYLFAGVLPFNLFRYVLVFLIASLLYKRLSMLIEMFAGDFVKDTDEDFVLLDENQDKEENLNQTI